MSYLFYEMLKWNKEMIFFFIREFQQGHLKQDNYSILPDWIFTVLIISELSRLSSSPWQLMSGSNMKDT